MCCLKFYEAGSFNFFHIFTEGDDITTAGSLQFDFKVIEAATDKFSICNKLGQGGFGKVYKVYITNPCFLIRCIRDSNEVTRSVLFTIFF